jgi:hypothetical protein
VPIEEVVPLADAPDVHTRLESGTTVGKLALEVRRT